MLMAEKYGNGAYNNLRPRLRITETGKSRPNAHAAFKAETKVSLGGFVGVEKKSKCFWNAV